MYPYTNPNFITKVLNAMKGIKWTSLLEGTQKTLGVVNQAIPVFLKTDIPESQTARAKMSRIESIRFGERIVFNPLSVLNLK